MIERILVHMKTNIRLEISSTFTAWLSRVVHTKYGEI